jgi:hypothetical protein
VSFKQKFKKKAVIQRCAAYHEAAHAVVALAVGVEVESVRILPKPQTGIAPTSMSEYQAAAFLLAGPISDAAVGLVPRPGDPAYIRWLLEPPSRDWLLFAGCVFQAVGIEPQTCAGQNNDGDLLCQAPREVIALRGAEINAWSAAIELVTRELCQQNDVRIASVARALLKQPSGLTAAQVREVAGHITAISPERLREVVDTLARNGLKAGEVSWREHKKLFAGATWNGWDRIAALKAVAT